MNFAFPVSRLVLTSTISLLAFLLSPLPPLRAEALTLLDQPRNFYDTPSQEFPDVPEYTTAGFDDFTLTTPTKLTSIIAYGREEGSPDQNIAVWASIWLKPSLSGSPLVSLTGIEIGSDLVFEPIAPMLSPGTYWLSAQVVRPISGGQWFWAESDTLTGEDAGWHNPGGGYGVGSEPRSLPEDGQALAFRIQGITNLPAESVPAPASVVGTLTALSWSRRLRRRIKASHRL